MSNTNIQYRASRVLILDHDPVSRDYLMYLLGRYYEVHVARGWDAAREILAGQQIDVLLIDVDRTSKRDDFTGLEALIAENAEACATILLGSSARPDVIARLLQRGVNDYITKPVQAPTILAHINTQLKMRRLINERQAAVTQLQKSEAIRQQFSRIASHDLKNSLNNLRLAEHLLRNAVGTNPSVRPVLDTIDLTIETMQRITEDFVDVAELQEDNMTLTIGVVDLQEVTVNVLMQYELAASAKGIKFHMGSLDGCVLADHARLVQALGNLVSNAIKYSPLGSVVSIWSEEVDASWRLCVADEGPGVPAAERGRLYEQFGKLSTRPTGGETSTGLGLWIVKHIMELQQGTTGAYFPNDGGSVFWLKLRAYVMAAEGIA